MRDLISRGDRSIRNIPVPANHRKVPLREREEEYDDDLPPPPRRSRSARGGRWFFWISIVIVLLCAAAGVLLSTLFAGATVSVTPRTDTVSMPASLTAQINAPSGSLAYNNVSTARSASIQVKTNGTEHVSRAASGQITIYNSFSSDSQRLIANTRFEAPDGKIYRIHSSVDVPGATQNATVPGSVTTKVFADSPGADYNRASTRLTIPGFKGDPRYTKFYAETNGITGGLVGDAPAIAPTDLSSAQTSLKQGLTSAMTEAATSQIPKEFISIPGTLSILYSDIIQAPAADGSATLNQTATATVYVLQRTNLASAVAKAMVAGYTGEEVDFVEPSVITVGVATSTKPQNGVLQLTFTGSPTLLWQFDPNALQAALVGKDKGAFESIVKSFAPAITCTKDTPCNASIRPFWSRSFPSDPAKIKVRVDS